MTRRDHDDPLLAAVTGVAYALEHGLDELRAQLLPTLGSQPLQAALAVPVSGPDARLRAASAGGRLLGWSLAETAGATARVRLRDGTAETYGATLAVITLAAGGSSAVHLGPGVSYVEGLTVEVVTGSVEGAVWLGASG